MFNITRRNIRIVCIVLAILYLTTALLLWAEPHGYLGMVARKVSMWRHQGFFLPVWLLNLMAFAHFTVFFFGLIGTAMFKRWGRNLLAFALLLALLYLPLQGEIVYSPTSAIFGGALSTLHVWFVTVLYWSPIGREFNATYSGKAT